MDILFALKRTGFWTQQLNWVWEISQKIVRQGPDTRPQALLLPNDCLWQGDGLEDPLCRQPCYMDQAVRIIVAGYHRLFPGWKDKLEARVCSTRTHQ